MAEIKSFDTDVYDRTYCALVTAFKPDGLEVDEEAYRKLVRYYTTNKYFMETKGSLVVNPEAGEIFYLSAEERRCLIRIVMKERPSEMPIFAGCYGLRMDEVIESALDAKSLGVDGIFVMPPAGASEVSTYYDGSGNPEVFTAYVRDIAEATQLPIIVHASHPSTPKWGKGLPIETVKMVLEEVPSVVGWKMIYGSMDAHFRIARYIRSLPRHVGILNAPHFCYHTALVCNLLDGAVQGAYNFNMESLVAHTIAWEQGDLDRAGEIWNKEIMPLQEYVYADRPRLHVRYKLATWIRGLISHPFMRPPNPQPNADEAERMYEVIRKTGLSHIERAEFDDILEKRPSIVSRVPRVHT